MLRDGQTGDWIGTFIGHKGAVWQARLSHDASSAATASADFTAKVWDPHTGECQFTISHNHIVRAVAYPPDSSDLLATGGYEKKLRIFDLSEASASAPPAPVENGDGKAQDGITIKADSGFEIGAGAHQALIKFIVWTRDSNILVTAAGNTLRWFDLPSRSVIKEEVLDGEIGSCEFNAPAPELFENSDIGGGLPVLAVAAGKSVYFWSGAQAMDELKRTKFGYKVASVAVDTKGRRFIVGEDTPSTWARVYRWDDDSEYGKHEGDTSNQVLFLILDGFLTALQTSTKATTAQCGLWLTRLTTSSMRLPRKMVRSSCGRIAMGRTDFGDLGMHSLRTVVRLFIRVPEIHYLTAS